MQRAMAKQAEAEREKRAKIIHAEGELQASAQLAQAANIIGSQPSTLQLRYLQTLTEIAVEKNSTIIFPLPLDLIEPFLTATRRFNEAASVNGLSRAEAASAGAGALPGIETGQAQARPDRRKAHRSTPPPPVPTCRVALPLR